MKTLHIYLHKFLPGALILGMLALLQGCGFFFAPMDPGPPPKNAHKVVKTAYTQIGKSYRAGGSSPQKGFDCSGLVWWAYSQNGFKVPRITTDQAKTGKAVSKKAVKSGDILVFKVSQSPRGLHTGLYAGNGSFIHSPSSGKRVCLEKIAPFWSRRLVAIRRVSTGK